MYPKPDLPHVANSNAPASSTRAAARGHADQAPGPDDRYCARARAPTVPLRQRATVGPTAPLAETALSRTSRGRGSQPRLLLPWQTARPVAALGTTPFAEGAAQPFRPSAAAIAPRRSDPELGPIRKRSQPASTEPPPAMRSLPRVDAAPSREPARRERTGGRRRRARRRPFSFTSRPPSPRRRDGVGSHSGFRAACDGTGRC